jgi:hypothetical protein
MTQDLENSDENQSPEEGGHFKLARGKITSLNVYEVSEYELAIFEDGGTSSTSLSFATFLLSAAISFLIVLFTVDLSKNNKMYFSFFLVTLVGFVLGIFMLISWWKSHRSVRSLGKTVRARLNNNTL